MTPGTIGLPGKCPAWYHSLPVKVCSPTARTPGSSSVTRSINRNGSRCGMSASIAALSSVDIASESRDKEGDHLAVVPFMFSEIATLRSDLADASRPVAECSACSWKIRRTRASAQEVVTASTSEERATPRCVVAAMSDVFARDPDRIAIDCGGAVVTPTRTRWVPDLGLVAREPVVRRRTGCGDVQVAHSGLRVDGCVPCAWEGRGPRDGYGDHAAAARGDADRRIDDVLVRVTVCAGQSDASGDRACGNVGLDDVPRDTGLVVCCVRVEAHGRVERAPHLAVRVHHLLHARVVGIEPRDDLSTAGVGGRADEASPTPRLGAEHRDSRRVVEAVTLRCGHGRSRARARLVGLRR